MLRDRLSSRVPTALAVGLLSLVALARADSPPARGAEADKLEEAKGLFEEGRFDEAVKAYKQAQKLAAGPCVECLLGLARSFDRLGAFKEVLKNVDAVRALSQDRAALLQAYNEQGIALLGLAGDDAKKLAAAEQAFRQVLELSGGQINAVRFSLGYTLLRLARDQEGVALLKEYLKGETTAVEAERARDLIANPLRARKRLVPDFQLVTLGGDYLSSEELKGRVLLLDFWGTWCAPCVAALPGLRNLSRRLEEEPFLLVSISTDSDEAALRAFISKEKMTWSQVWDKRQEFTHKCSIEAFPTYLLVGPEGEIVYSVSGWGQHIESELNQQVNRAVRAARRSGKATDGLQ